MLEPTLPLLELQVLSLVLHARLDCFLFLDLQAVSLRLAPPVLFPPVLLAYHVAQGFTRQLSAPPSLQHALHVLQGRIQQQWGLRHSQRASLVQRDHMQPLQDQQHVRVAQQVHTMGLRRARLVQ